MMRALVGTCFAVATIGSAHAQSINQLKQDLAQREATLANLTTSINSSAGSDFSTSKDVEANLKMSVLQKWLNSFSIPLYRIRADETSADGTVAYKGGSYNVWFDQHNNWVEIDFSGLNIHAAASQIFLQGQARISGSAEFDYSILGSNGYQVCQMDTATLPVAAVLQVSGGDGQANYQIDVTAPSSIPGIVKCQILRGPYLYLPINLGSAAQKVSAGSIDVGYSGSFILTPPPPLRPTKIDLSSQDGAVEITTEGINMGFNVSITSGVK